MRDNVSEPFDRTHAGRVLPKRNVSPYLIVQLYNITPTGPKNGKFFIPGIASSLGSTSTPSALVALNLEKRPYLTFTASELAFVELAVSRRSEIVCCLQLRFGC